MLGIFCYTYTFIEFSSMYQSWNVLHLKMLFSLICALQCHAQCICTAWHVPVQLARYRYCFCLCQCIACLFIVKVIASSICIVYIDQQTHNLLLHELLICTSVTTVLNHITYSYIAFLRSILDRLISCGMINETQFLIENDDETNTLCCYFFSFYVDQNNTDSQSFNITVEIDQEHCQCLFLTLLLR